MEQAKLIGIIAVITLISGFGDSYGFTHASKIWENSKIVWDELGKSALGFSIGIGMYWVVLKYVKEFGVVTPESQTLLWFSATIIGLAIISGKFFQWHIVDQAIAIIVAAGVCWLLFRTGG